MVITSIAAPFADNLISSGVDTTKVNHCLEDEKGINKNLLALILVGPLY